MTDSNTLAGKNRGNPPKNAAQAAARQNRQQRVISNPEDVAKLVMMQVDAVNAKKDELTIATKRLTDTTKQLVRAYAEHAKAIQKLQLRIKTLEEEKDK